MRELWSSRFVRWFAAFAWMGVIFFLSAQSSLPDLTPGMPHLEEIGGHLMAYAVLGLLWERALRGADVRRAGWWAFAIAVLYGLSDEFHQSFVPGRTMSAVDLATDMAGAAAALLMIRKRHPPPPPLPHRSPPRPPV